MQHNLNNSLNSLPPISWGILVILLCLFIIGLIFFKRRTPKHKDLQQKVLEQKLQTLKTAISVMGPITDSVNKIKKNNDNAEKALISGWELPLLLRQVRAIFIQINRCLQDNAIEQIRAFCEPETYQALILSLPLQKKRKIINSSLDIKFLEHKKKNSKDIVSVKISGDFLTYGQPEDLLSVKIDEELNTVPDSNSKKLQHFSEIWTFVLETIPQEMIEDFKLERWLFAGNQEFINSKYDNNAIENNEILAPQ